MATKTKTRTDPASAKAVYARSHPSVLRAAGVRIERASAEQMRITAGQRQRWQTLAWGYRDLIGELRAALQFRAQAISRVRFYIAEIVDDDDDEPVAVSARTEKDKDGQPSERAKKVTLPEALCRAAEDELSRLPLDAGDSFLGIWSENFDVAGECWLYGYRDPDTEEEIWEIRSIDDVDVQGSTVTIKDALGQPRSLNLDPDSGEELYRLWRKHARRPYMADSSLNACLDTLEDITLNGRELRAAARSRIMANGILFIPNGFAATKNVKKDDDRTPTEKFMGDLTAALIAPIGNEGDAGAVAPVVVMGSKEDIEAVRYERLEREDSPTLIEKLKSNLGRMGQSLEIPPEIVTGMADVNHWTAWQIDMSTFRYYLEPGIRLMADSLTQSFVRKALKGWPPDLVRRVRVWFDAGAITENPNRRDDTITALDRMLIGGRTGRKELGFGEADAPSPEEVIQMIAAKQGFDAATAAKVLTYLANQEGANLPELSPTVVPTQRQLPPARPQDPVPVPEVPTVPDTTPPALSAAAPPRDPQPQWELNSELGASLAEIERAARDEILLAADKAVERALSKAANRLRSKAQRDPQLLASLRPVPLGTWAATVGRDQAFGLGADLRFLLKDAFTELGEKFTTSVKRAIDSMVSRILRFLGYKPDTQLGKRTGDRIRNAMGGRIRDSWARLHNALEQHTDKLLFGDTGEPVVDGEQSDLRLPVDIVRTALAVIGGLPETAAGVDDKGRIPTGEPFTGLADGTTVVDALAAEGVVPFGREWRYNPTLERNTFLPHYDLDGERFTSWEDDKLKAPPEYAWIGAYFRPKDHLGCLCTTAVTYAVPSLSRSAPLDVPEVDYDKLLAVQLRDRLAQPSQDMAYNIELAESDDRAGRKFTVAQQTRDQYNEVQRLKNLFLNGE